MKELKYTVRFITPAFLGNAEQKGQWRTPPFKALIRQWWRVVRATQLLRDKGWMVDPGKLHAEVREEEERLFGHAGQSSSQRSALQIRLSSWKLGRLDRWDNDPRIPHPEVTNPVGAHLYLGYGPLTYGELPGGKKGASGRPLKGTVLGMNASSEVRNAIAAGETCDLTLFPASDELLDSIVLIHWFGAIGGRSRNGWGSLALNGMSTSSEDLAEVRKLAERFGRSFEDCMEIEWPHAFGKDGRGPLVWRTASRAGWAEVMKDLAEIKIAFRTALSITRNQDAANPVPDDRHVLSYPVTNHGVVPWGSIKFRFNKKTQQNEQYVAQDDRLANQARFKVLSTRDGKYQALVYHLPCQVPGVLAGREDLNDPFRVLARQLDIWRKVHQVLDSRLVRI